MTRGSTPAQKNPSNGTVTRVTETPKSAIEEMNEIFKAQRSAQMSESKQGEVIEAKETTKANLIDLDEGEEQNTRAGGAARRLNLTEGGKWANIIAGKTLTAKGASITFIPPVMKDGKHVAQLSKSEVDELTKVWSTAVILYVVGQTPSIGVITRYIEQVWNYVSKPKIFLHDKGYFVVKFSSIDDKNEVLYGGPHMLNSRPIIVKADF